MKTKRLDPSLVTDINFFLQDDSVVNYNRRSEPPVGAVVHPDYLNYLYTQYQSLGGGQKVESTSLLNDLEALANMIPKLSQDKQIQELQQQYKKIDDEDNDLDNILNDIKVDPEKFNEISQQLANYFQRMNIQFKELSYPEAAQIMLKNACYIQTIPPFPTQDDFNKGFNEIVEKPCRGITKCILDAGGMTFFSNGFGQGPKGVFWYDENRDVYFTSLKTQETYSCIKIDVGGGAPYRFGEVIDPGIDFSKSWPTLEEFTQKDPSMSTDLSQPFELICELEEPTLAEKLKSKYESIGEKQQSDTNQSDDETSEPSKTPPT